MPSGGRSSQCLLRSQRPADRLPREVYGIRRDGSARIRMHSGGTKLRAAEWLYRWNLSLSILGVVFTILTFLGVFTLLLRPVFSQVGLSDLQTALILLLLVVAVIIGFGVFLDKIVR